MATALTEALVKRHTPQVRVAYGTGAVAIDHTLTPGYAIEVLQVELHMSAAGGAGNITLTCDSGLGTEYDTILTAVDLTSLADWLYLSTRPIIIDKGDALAIAFANASTRTWGLKAYYRVLDS